MDSRGGYVSKVLYFKTKESGPLEGGVRRACRPLDPPMRNLKVISDTPLDSLPSFMVIGLSFLERPYLVRDLNFISILRFTPCKLAIYRYDLQM